MRLRLSVLLALISLAVPAAALTPHLVKDINLIPASSGSKPEAYVTVGGIAFFTAIDSLTGRELYRTDGTAAGTFQVVDACTGPCIGGPAFVAQNGKSYFFTASSAESESDLWVSGGLPVNTFRLTGGLNFPGQGTWSAWIAGQGVLYFAADDGIHGMELWRTDGTLAGTHLAVDLRPGPEGSNPGDLTDFNGRLFFRANDGRNGPALWTSDGTPAGTRAVRDPVAGSASHTGPVFLRVVGRTLFFVAPVKNRGFELWKSDGTTAGTVALTNARFATARPFIDFSVFGNRLMFVAADPKQGQELWTSDGTAGGTRALTSLPKADAFVHVLDYPDLPLPQFSLGNRFLFRADDGAHGAELWTTDGTPKGTRMLKDLCPGACWGAASELVAVGGRAFFTGSDGPHGFEPWSTDGTVAGTRMIRDLCAGDQCFHAPVQWRVGKSKAFFVRQDDSSLVPQLWSTDGTAAGTVRLATSSVSQYNLPSTPFGRGLLFTAGDGAYGSEPWVTDGTPQGTRLAADINVTNAGGSRPYSFISASGKTYFFAYDGEHGSGAFWVSDGTAAGTKLVADLYPDHEPFNPPYIPAFAEAGGLLYFVVEIVDGNGSFELWRTDGTAAGTVRLLPEGEAQLTPFTGLAALGNRVFFAASDGASGSELWVSDGTAAGTRMVVDLDTGYPDDPGSSPRNLTTYQGKLYFSAAVGEAARELWRSDGTPEGTVLFKDIDTRPLYGSEPGGFVEHAGRLYFVARNGDLGAQLWSTDGTPAGTVPLDLLPASSSSNLGPLMPVGSKLFFFGGSNELGHGLWITDLTAAGTQRISDVLLGDFRDIARPTVFNGRLYFSGTLPSTYINDLWVSDGTAAGTGALYDREGRAIRDPLFLRVFANRLVFTTYLGQDLYESDGTQAGTVKLLDLTGPYNTNYFELSPAGSRLLFENWDRDHGFELWALEAE
ncbi:MAG TPA: ELWxxDGT repeat protein [Thermoanaerobaculia bacterium]